MARQRVEEALQEADQVMRDREQARLALAAAEQQAGQRLGSGAAMAEVEAAATRLGGIERKLRILAAGLASADDELEGAVRAAAEEERPAARAALDEAKAALVVAREEVEARIHDLSVATRHAAEVHAVAVGTRVPSIAVVLRELCVVAPTKDDHDPTVQETPIPTALQCASARRLVQQGRAFFADPRRRALHEFLSMRSGA
ncbi:MAG TPA: hypothetical protein PLS53_10285 [Thermoanaerobaculaceae bacterium]|nr:hypothetical protein [Thermoanaerobaculaceae bacterium]